VSLSVCLMKAATRLVMHNSEQITAQIPDLHYQISLTLCWRSISEHGRNCAAFCFAYKGCQYVGYAYQRANHGPNTLLTGTKMIDALYTLLLGGRCIVTNHISTECSQSFDYGLLPLHSPWISHDAPPYIIDAPLTLISRMGQWACHFSFTYNDIRYFYSGRTWQHSPLFADCVRQKIVDTLWMLTINTY